MVALFEAEELRTGGPLNRRFSCRRGRVKPAVTLIFPRINLYRRSGVGMSSGRVCRSESTAYLHPVFASLRVWGMVLVEPSPKCRFARGNSDVVEAFLGLVTTGLTDWN